MSSVSSIYNSIALDYDKVFPGRNKYIDVFAGMLPKKSRILEAGCGAGYDAYYLSKMGFRVTSIDTSRGMLSIAKKKFPRNKFRLGDMKKLNYKNGSFSGIVAAFSIIHLRKKAASTVIKKFHRFLRKDGLIYLALQEGNGERYVTEPFDPKKKLFVNFYTMPEIKKTWSRSGFVSY